MDAVYIINSTYISQHLYKILNFVNIEECANLDACTKEQRQASDKYLGDPIHEGCIKLKEI